MKKIIAIVFLLLLFFQAIPVAGILAASEDAFYSYVDEEKPGENKIEDKKEGKEYIPFDLFVWSQQSCIIIFDNQGIYFLATPYLQYLTPPPDNAC